MKQVKIKSLKAYKHPVCTHSSTGKTVFGLFLDTNQENYGPGTRSELSYPNPADTIHHYILNPNLVE